MPLMTCVQMPMSAPPKVQGSDLIKGQHDLSPLALALPSQTPSHRFTCAPRTSSGDLTAVLMAGGALPPAASRASLSSPETSDRAEANVYAITAPPLA